MKKSNPEVGQVWALKSGSLGCLRQGTSHVEVIVMERCARSDQECLRSKGKRETFGFHAEVLGLGILGKHPDNIRHFDFDRPVRMATPAEMAAVRTEWARYLAEYQAGEAREAARRAA